MTRGWIRHAVSRPERAPLAENENGCAWRAHHVMLYTPLMLNRYGGNLNDPDPKYNHSEMYPGDHLRRMQFMTAPCLSIVQHLDYGSLSAGYDGMFKNSTVAGAPNIYATMVPTTPWQIGEGFVLGLERAISRVDGDFAPPRPHGLTSSLTYLYDDCLLSKPPTSGPLSVSLRGLGAHQIAVVVWQ